MGARVHNEDGRPWDVEKAGGFKSLPIGAVLGFVNPMLGTLGKALESLAPPGHPDQEAYPDPYVRVLLNEAVVSRELRSASLPNTLNPNWDYSFYAQLSTLRESGIDIVVLDDDGGDSSGARVGAVALPRANLERVALTGRTVNMTVAADDLESMYVRIEPVQNASAAASYVLPLSDGMLVTDLLVHAGSQVTIRVDGQGQIGAGGVFGCTPDVTPRGLEHGECRNYNLSYKELRTAPHGSAFALFGRGSGLEPVTLVDDGTGATCIEVVAPTGGALTFGVNDNHFSNNSGEYRFDVTIEPAGTASKGCGSTLVDDLAANDATDIQLL